VQRLLSKLICCVRTLFMKTIITQMNLFVEQYDRRMLPITPRFGFSVRRAGGLIMAIENEDAQFLSPSTKPLNPSFLKMRAENEDAQFPSLRDIVRRLFRRRWLILSIFLPVVIVVTAGNFLVLPSYEATAKILLRKSSTLRSNSCGVAPSLKQ
jgi:hypothetical protein